MGNRTQIVEHTGRTVSYEYNSVNQLIKETVTNDPKQNNTITTYEYDEVGNLKTKTINGVATTYDYNDNDQLITQNTQIFTYDDNGNLIQKDDTTYSYDDKNRLIKVQTPTDTVEYNYDANDNRIAKTTSNETTTYLVDTNTPYAQIITESKENGTKIGYTYGNDLLHNGTHFYLTDALGSTRGLVDGGEKLTDSYSYTPYGELSDHNGTSDNSFLYAGEQLDKETENYYLRARYYNPENTRFLTRDTYDGVDDNPITQNHYLYGNANPVMYADPSGHMSMLNLSANISMRGVLVNTRTHTLGLAKQGFFKTFGCDLAEFMVTQTMEEGIYLLLANGTKPYVGQSQSVDTRLKQHLGKRLDNIADVLQRFHFEGLDGSKNKELRETIEQVILDAIGGKDSTDNRVNPIGDKRKHKMPDYIERIKKIICKK